MSAVQTLELNMSAERDEQARARMIRLHGDLTAPSAAALVQAVSAAIASGSSEVAIDVRAAKAADVVGLATLLQCTEAAKRASVTLSVIAPDILHGSFTKARLCDDIPFVTAFDDADAIVEVVEAPRHAEGAPFVAQTRRIGLRQPTWDELALFERWANERWLDEMVGSDLLYRVRHLGPYHPDVVAEVFASPTSLILLVEPLESPGRPVGFVRLFDIQLAEGIGFLETVVTSGDSLRKGWGVDASRVLLAYAMDVLGTVRVEAKVYGYNVLSANALRRNGFREEGVLRAAHRYHGERWDILVFAILEDGLRAQRSRGHYPYFGFWGAGEDSLKPAVVVAD